MYIIFYKAMAGNFIDKIIAWWTSSINEKVTGKWKDTFSHCELLFTDGLMFSASQYENRTRYKIHNKDSYNWVRLPIECSVVNENKVRAFCDSIEGASYDYKGILGFITGIKDDSTKWFCSEVCTTGLQSIGEVSNLDAYRTSPNDLYKELTK